MKDAEELMNRKSFFVVLPRFDAVVSLYSMLFPLLASECIYHSFHDIFAVSFAATNMLNPNDDRE